MDKAILEALEEMENVKCSSVEEAIKIYGKQELFDIWLRYEGISGYTNKILNVLIKLGTIT